ncbi:MAG TPA: prolyl oligopeptidase family serine peptidase [Acidobacteriota bacterium]|nr:prolyl oligopeptidase family serine peptidase [Acidobacteriota bacterium]
MEPYSFPAFEEAAEAGDIELYAEREEYRRAVADSDYEFFKISYQSDGLAVRCYLYRPAKPAPRPTVVFNRGSYLRGDIAPELITLFHRFAQEGFTVLAPLYRGSDGGQGRDEMGGDDLNDLLNVVPLAKSLESVDSDQLFLYGESRGGMMVLQALREGFPARAAAVYGAFSDLGALFQAEPERYMAMARQVFPDFPQRMEDIIERRSAVKWADRISVPLMILHGGEDQSIPPLHALKLAEKLEEYGKTYELLIYANDNHILSRHRNPRDRRVAAWFRSHGSR